MRQALLIPSELSVPFHRRCCDFRPPRELAEIDTDLNLLCQKFRLVFGRRQHGHRGSDLSKAAAIRSRKVVMDDGTWR